MSVALEGIVANSLIFIQKDATFVAFSTEYNDLGWAFNGNLSIL